MAPDLIIRADIDRSNPWTFTQLLCILRLELNGGHHRHCRGDEDP
jgi:hypothetical protein